MAILEINLTPKKFKFRERVLLEGTFYVISFRYNNRGSIWIMDFLTEDEDPIITGTPVLLGVVLMSEFVDSRLPPGRLFIINIENEFTEPTVENFGENIKLLYDESTA